jgi:hypothetical protein
MAIHIGRSWSGHPLEDNCPCPKAPCGLVDMDQTDPACLEHPAERVKSIRQSHAASACPALGPVDETQADLYRSEPCRCGTGLNCISASCPNREES